MLTETSNAGGYLILFGPSPVFEASKALKKVKLVLWNAG